MGGLVAAMNYPTVYGVQVQPSSCGRTANENRARAFWQSRMTTVGSGIAEPPPLVDIHALAEAVRASFLEPETC